MSFIDQIQPEWSLFLDRDGVINVRPMNDYVRQLSDFSFLPDVEEALALLSGYFSHIFIVTNQQGVGKGLMSQHNLDEIHDFMKSRIELAGGLISRIYTCTELEDTAGNCRKPAPLMAYLAKKDFPEIDFSCSVMVGDTISDIQFGRNAGMHTVFVHVSDRAVEADLYVSSLMEFARLIQKNKLLINQTI
jgi:D-glycero-D-manno-heptose 1,7-bisphosphate phosphatase